MHPSHRTWRIRGIPLHFDRDRLARALRNHSDLQLPDDVRAEDLENGGNDVIVRTLAPDLRLNNQVATVCFHKLPLQLFELGARDQLNIEIKLDQDNL